VWYRVEDDGRWRVGLTEHISAGEVVIRTDEPIRAVRPITLVVSLPRPAGTRCGACVVARGRIKRAPRLRRNRSATVSVAVRRSKLEVAHRAFDRRAA
jgi:hypothetical protein